MLLTKSYIFSLFNSQSLSHDENKILQELNQIIKKKLSPLSSKIFLTYLVHTIEKQTLQSTIKKNIKKKITITQDNVDQYLHMDTYFDIDLIQSSEAIYQAKVISKENRSKYTVITGRLSEIIKPNNIILSINQLSNTTIEYYTEEEVSYNPEIKDIFFSKGFLYYTIIIGDEIIDKNKLLTISKNIITINRSTIINMKEMLPIKTKKSKIPQKIRGEVYMKYNSSTQGHCYICDGYIDINNYHVGHIIPETKGGLNTVDNLRPICQGCNLSMGIENMLSWGKKYGYKGKFLQEISH